MKLINKFKVLTVIGTRPELIKMSEIIKSFDINFDHKFIHTGQNYDQGLRDVFYDDLELRRPDYNLDLVSPNPVQTIANVMVGIDKIIEIEKPDAFVIYGDTNSCLSVITAKRKKIPIFHLEAGNRCFNQNVPEELNRKIVDHLSDINLPLTEHARRYLIQEGLSQDRIFKIGSTLPEVLKKLKNKFLNSKILKTYNLKKDNFFLVSFHREENVDNKENLAQIIDCLNWISKNYKIPVIVSLHPRTKSKIEKNKIKLETHIKFCKPFSYTDYLNLQLNSKLVISDSGTITEESSILNFKAITIRNENERPEGFDSNVLIMSSLKLFNFQNSTKIALNLELPEKVNDYMQYKVSEKVVKIISSYINFVNINVWKKS